MPPQGPIAHPRDRPSARARAAAPVPAPGAVRASFPGFVEPCLATLRARVPEGGAWIHEVKFDGYRAQARLANGKPSILTRRGYDWTPRFASIARALSELPAREAVLDGEVVVLDSGGLSDYHRLQEDLGRGRTDRLVFYAFDLLYVDGFDLRNAALTERKRVLAELLRGADAARLRFSEHLEAEGAAVFEQACAMRLEGIVSKERGAPYRSGRQKTWLKIKCTKSDTFPVVAFVEKLGAKPRRIASLYVGRYEDGALRYAGKVQSGFTEAVQREIRERLDPFVRAKSALDVPVKKPKATWVEPVLPIEVRFSSVTSDGLLREAVFKGIRDDLVELAEPWPAPALRTAVVRGARKPPSAAALHGVPKENILQLLPDAVAPSKDELAAYWTKVADRALPYLAGRPLKLVRRVHGTIFYHMGPLPPIPASVRRLKIEKREGGEGTRLWVEDLEGLLGLVDIGVVEVHPWNSTVDDLEHPDVLVFDLDPGEGVGLTLVVESALAMRELLLEEGLESWPKLTGGNGVHVMAPIEPGIGHDAARRRCRAIAAKLASRDRRYTLSSRAARAGRLFIDYLRNGRGTTAVGTYSPRARPGFPIAAPATWKQIEDGIRPDAFTLERPFSPRRDAAASVSGARARRR
ncbi:MAG TPA: DNA ligase D [Gammaproteobacteria bacterium]|nr:DNA ligase D [Gammaproteobacteria bacterium]